MKKYYKEKCSKAETEESKVEELRGKTKVKQRAGVGVVDVLSQWGGDSWPDKWSSKAAAKSTGRGSQAWEVSFLLETISLVHRRASGLVAWNQGIFASFSKEQEEDPSVQ